MIDLSNVNAYRESIRIEAKKSLGGLPKSLWERFTLASAPRTVSR